MSKMLDKISKLLAKAENAGTPEEAETFMAKVQELATLNGIDLAVARMHQAKKERVQEIEERRISVNPYSRKRCRKHFVDLALVIAAVNDVKCTITSNDAAIFAIGFPSDLDVVEALNTHLAVQMVAECDAELKRGANRQPQKVLKTEKVLIPEDDRVWGEWDGKSRYYDEEGEEGQGTDRWGNYRSRAPYPPPTHKEVPVLDEDGNKIYEEKVVSVVDGRVFRNNFYDSFVIRMSGRLWEIKRSAEREAGVLETSSSTAIALRNKKEEVNEAHDERIRVQHITGEYRGAKVNSYSSLGREAGTKAAERVPVNEGRAVDGVR